MINNQIDTYVGVTGIQSTDQLNSSIDLGRKIGFGLSADHNLMYGMLVSAATVSNEAPRNTAMPFRHVATREELVDILSAAQDQQVVGMIHMELTKAWGRDASAADETISLLSMLDGQGLKPAVQLNGVLSSDSIHRIAEETGAPLVLQLRRQHTERGEADVFRYLADLQDSVAKVLVDASAGEGKIVNPQQAAGWQRRIEAEFQGVFSFGHAGGLGGSQPQQMQMTTDIILDLARELGGKGFSTDIESRSRRSIDGASGPEDVFNQRLYADSLRAIKKGFDLWDAESAE